MKEGKERLDAYSLKLYSGKSVGLANTSPIGLARHLAGDEAANKVKKAIESTNIINHVFDGEICLLDENMNEDFQSVMKEIKKKDHTIEDPVFKIFDMLHISEFNGEKDSSNLEHRLLTLRTFLYQITSNYSHHLMYEDQMVITGDEHFQGWTDLAADITGKVLC